MRIVIALGGNALLQRGQPMTAAAQRGNVRKAAEAIAPPVATTHEVVLSHGNGPQVGLLALQAAEAAGKGEDGVFPPLDVLGAETEGGMIGYLIEQELGNLLPEDQPLATLLTMVEVDADDPPAFSSPTKFVGPVYTRHEADRLAASHTWTFRQDGAAWRRVVPPSPEPPQRIFEIRPIRWLLERGGTVVICTGGGGGIPTMYSPNGRSVLTGVEAVIDKDRASALLARETGGADLLIMQPM